MLINSRPACCKWAGRLFLFLLLEHLSGELKIPLLLLEDWVKLVTFLLFIGGRLTGFEFIRTIGEDIRRNSVDINTSVAFIRKPTPPPRTSNKKIPPPLYRRKGF